MNEMTRISAQPAYSDAARQALARRPQLFIDGAWVDSSGGATLPVVDPSTGREISRFVDATDADVDRAVAAARTAFDDGRWTRLPPIAREGLILKLADLLERHADEFAELEAIDNGKPKAIAAAIDIPASIRMLRYTAGWTTKLGGEMIDPAGAPAGAFHAYVRREPVGVAAQIVPWNFPMIMATQKIAPALAAGCTLVLKPAEQTSVTALRLADLVAEAGFPGGVINVATGLGETPTADYCQLWRDEHGHEDVVTLFDPTGAVLALWPGGSSSLSAYVDRDRIIRGKLEHDANLEHIEAEIEAALAP